jgi:hypothetical protein
MRGVEFLDLQELVFARKQKPPARDVGPRSPMTKHEAAVIVDRAIKDIMVARNLSYPDAVKALASERPALVEAYSSKEIT